MKLGISFLTPLRVIQNSSPQPGYGAVFGFQTSARI